MMENHAPPRRFRYVALVLGGIGLVVLGASWLVGGRPPSLHLWILIAAAVVSENFALSLPVFNVSLAFPLIVAATVLEGPEGAALVAAFSFTNWGEIRTHRPKAVLLFNFGQLVVSAHLGARVYEVLGGTVVMAKGGSPLGPVDLPVSTVAILAAAFAITLPNMLMTAYAAMMLRSRPFLRAFGSMFAYVPTQLALAGVGLLLAQVLTIEIVALPLFLFPLMLARGTYQRYETLERVYIDTVKSLIAALEAKDPYTRGHSERVSSYAVRLARKLGLQDGDVERVGQAGLLHDIGKLSLTAAILTKPGRLTEAESVVMKRHPEIGAGMVERIPLLRDLAEHVRAHHERPDGTGYPSGCFGHEIPTLAKILAVVDAYDAMTTTRPYSPALTREQALSELVQASGAQFDPLVVSSFVELLSSRAINDVRHRVEGAAAKVASTT